jgi:tRNA threonylcarbamoyladenosine biosynthesis protein TsaB
VCYRSPVRILAIECSGPRGSVALVQDRQVVHERTHDVANAHAETLVLLIDATIRESGWARTSLDAVAVGLGPGSFTGLRVGVGLAQGIALGLNRPLRGVSSLRALAARGVPELAEGAGAKWYGALTDARRGEFFFAAYEANLSECVAPVAIAQSGAAAAIQLLTDGRAGWLGGGRLLPEDDAGRRYEICRLPEFQSPSAGQVGLLCQSAWAESTTLPLYLRDADALIPNIVPNALLERGSLARAGTSEEAPE